MVKNAEIVILAGAYILMLIVMFILPFYSVPEYSIIRNTLGQLGAQNSPNAWLMNLTFVSLGIGSIIAGWRYLSGFIFHRMLLLIFGLSLIMTAFLNHAPINPEIQYSIAEDGWHSYFACTTGLSFTIFAITTAFILENKNDRVLAFVTALSATFLSIFMAELDQFAGIWQRLIFLTCFGWMIYNFRSVKIKWDISINRTDNNIENF